ncbi:hypothetical protein ABZ656_20325 [Streptomyces sp. NPDC007095]|jgi:hypothetical protein|uniref:hypothetical protein n=1 Tax=Streptomyces sp. NPDC007095 TaxID=3154482 RepID=UPI0033FAB785
MTSSVPTPSTPNSSAAGPADLLITGCTALVHDEHEEIGFVEDASIVVRAGVIEAATRETRLADARPCAADIRSARHGRGVGGAVARARRSGHGRRIQEYDT